MSMKLYGVKKKDVVVIDLSTEGLEPLKHKILGITTKTEEAENVFTDRDEAVVLRRFWEYIRARDFERIIGFNSDAFDIPFLTIRSLKHGVSMTDLQGRLIDLRKAAFLGMTDRKGTLDDFRELMGISQNESRFKKMHLSLFWETEDIDGLKDFLLNDVRVSWELFERLLQVGLI